MYGIVHSALPLLFALDGSRKLKLAGDDGRFMMGSNGGYKIFRKLPIQCELGAELGVIHAECLGFALDEPAIRSRSVLYARECDGIHEVKAELVESA